MDENSLTHYGVLGMKWGRRKQKVSKGSNTKKSSKTNKKASKQKNVVKKREKILTDSRKEAIKSIAKTTAKVAGAVAATTILGYAGTMAYSEFSRMAEQYHRTQTLDSMSKALDDASKLNFNSAGKNASNALDHFSKTKGGSELSKGNIGNASKEYWEELMNNSKKNKYPW